MKRKIISVTLLLLLTYVSNPFYFKGIISIQKLCYYVFALFPFFVAVYKGVKIDFNSIVFILYFYICFITAFLVVGISGSFDFQYIIYLIRILLNISAQFSVFFIFNYFNKKIKLNFSFSKLYLDSVIFYIWGTVFFILFPHLRLFWSSILADLGKMDFSDFIEYVTRFGFIGFSGFGIAFMVSVATIVSCYLYLHKEISLTKFKIDSFILLIGSFFYGRIGFVFTFFCLGFFSFYLLFNKRPKLFLFYIFLLPILVVIIFLIYFIVPNTQPVIEWLFEPLIIFFQGGKLESRSTNRLGEMYELFNPTNQTLLHGDGYWWGLNGDGYYGETDVGFMRNIYYGGVLYTMILYSAPLLLILIFYLLTRNAGKKAAILIFFLMICQLLIFEIKGFVVYDFLRYYFPIFISIVYIKNDSIKFNLLSNEKNGGVK